MKILLLGAGGFLGRHLMVYFRDQGHDVTPVFHKSSVNKDGLSIAMEDERSLASIPLEVEVVINCAAIVPPDQLQILPGHLDPVNGYGLLLLLERLKNLSIHFIHISSSHCLPRQSAIVGGTYEASKFAGEVLCQVYRKQFQNDITLIRPSYIYGPSMRETTVVMKFIQNAILGKPIRVIGDPHKKFNFIYVSDVAKVVEYAILNRGIEYFAVSDTHTSLQELAETIVSVFESQGGIQYLPETGHQKIENSINSQTSPITKNIPLHEGIQRMKAIIQ